MNIRLKASLLAASIAALPFGADAAGLGRLNVMSALGQPLRAEVELFATAQELQSLIARVPSQEAFKQANVAYTPGMAGLRLAVEQRGGRSVLKISSDKPVNAPFVDLLIELNWTGGHVLRDYTFLLDPVEMAPARAAVEAPVPVARPHAAAPASSAARPAAEAPARAGSGGGYEVQRGDTLRRIAAETRSEGVSLDQMTVALFRANPSAFDGENINRLKAGKILAVPDAATAQAIPAAEARKEIAAHSSDFEGYRRNLAAAVAEAPAQGAAPAGQESGGRITPKVSEPAASGASKDQVKVSSLDAAKTGPGAAPAARLQALEEDVVARDKALRDANTRLAELEKSIQDLQQKLLEMKSPGMAQAQRSAQAGTAAVAPAPAAPGQAASAPADAAAPAAPAAPAPEAAAPPPPKPKPVAPPPPAQEPGFVASLLSDPMMLLGGGGILALLLGYAAFKRRRHQPQQVLPSRLSEFPEATSSVFATKGGQSVDTGNSSILQTDFSQSDLSSVDADEGVDPVAEADVYMAYGRDAQAEEILIDALKVDPSRGAVYVKLLEIYAHRKSLKQFDSLMADFYSMTGGKGPDWERAAAIGRKLDPNNPMYGTPSASEGATSGPANPGVAVAAGVAAAGVAAAGVAAVAQGTFGPATARESARPQEPAVEPSANNLRPEANALDFDLDLGSGTAAESFDSAATAVDVDHLLDPTNFDANVFSEQVPETPVVQPLEFERPRGAASRQPMADLSATVVHAPAKESPDGELMDLEKTSLNTNVLNFDFDAPQADQNPTRPLTVDLSDIDLNLDAGDHLTSLETVTLNEPAERSGVAGSDELDTKLELARAYEDLGDRDGAKELLAEVLQEGNAEQQSAARALLRRLG